MSNDVGDGNENGRNPIGLISKTTTLPVYHIFSTDFFAVISKNQFVGQVFFYFVKAAFGCNFSPTLVDNVMIIMHMSVLSCGALFLGPRLPRPGKDPQVTRRMFSVIFFYSGTFIALVRPYVPPYTPWGS